MKEWRKENAALSARMLMSDRKMKGRLGSKTHALPPVIDISSLQNSYLHLLLDGLDLLLLYLKVADCLLCLFGRLKFNLLSGFENK